MAKSNRIRNVVLKRKAKDEEAKDYALSAVKMMFNIAIKKHGFENARWAFRKVIELNSEKVKLLKKKEELEKELAAVNKAL